MLKFSLLLGLVALAKASLPNQCTPLNEEVFSNVDISALYGTSDELASAAPPTDRVGDLRSSVAIPTQHFATNAFKTFLEPVRQIPYSLMVFNNGIDYDAYTMDYWTDPNRTDLMMQLTPGTPDEPWNKVTSVGTNMKQMTSGPEGSPKSQFSGISGVKLGLANSGDPVLSSIGLLHVDFKYTNTDGGTMEVPIVQGSPVITHTYTNADPIVYPNCLSAINGQQVSDFPCTEETVTADGGSGYTEATCSGSDLVITFHSTKPIDMSLIQYAVETPSNWPGAMISCDDTHCTTTDNMEYIITVEGVSGDLNYAINVIGYYTVPWGWTDTPSTVSCSRKRREIRTEVPTTRNDPPPTPNDGGTCSSNVCYNPTCVLNGDNYQLDLGMVFNFALGDISELQVAVNSRDNWDNSHPMISCTPETCALSADGLSLNYRMMVEGGAVSYAINRIGYYTDPSDWVNSPYNVQCGDSGIVQITPAQKFVLELDEPGDAIPDNTRKFILYFTETMQADVQIDGIKFTTMGGEPFTGTAQMLFVGSTDRSNFDAVDFADTWAGTYPYRPTASYCVQGDTGYINFDWNMQVVDIGTNNQDQLLMVAMPHVEDQLTDEGISLFDTPYTFKGTSESSWTWREENLPRASMLPDSDAVAKVKNNPQQLAHILTSLDKDSYQRTEALDSSCVNSGSYFGGKDIGMVARLASISRAFGTTHYEDLDVSLLACLNKWIRVDDTLNYGDQLVYDLTWGGLWSPGNDEGQPFDVNANFGFPGYNDHHFHFGYWVYAMAYYATFYPSWATQYRERILAFARDFANPSINDAYYPVTRHKDWYTGFSWATGIGVGGARTEESSSEGINGYHAIAALGEALGDTTMTSMGRLLLATEIRSVKEYFHVTESTAYHFPDILKEYGTIGMITEDNYFTYSLFWACDPDIFPARHACLVGIQVLPIVAISAKYMDQEWGVAVKDVCTWASNPSTAPGADEIEADGLEAVNVGWGALCYAAMAQADQESMDTAVNFVSTLETNDLQGGTGLASTLLFLYGQT